jgi:hypothetical protein
MTRGVGKSRILPALHWSRSMRRRFRYTITPGDRRVYQQWLIGVSAFYGCIALMVLFAVLIRSYAGGAGEGTAAALERRAAVSCPISITDGRPACEPQFHRGER